MSYWTDFLSYLNQAWFCRLPVETFFNEHLRCRIGGGGVVGGRDDGAVTVILIVIVVMKNILFKSHPTDELMTCITSLRAVLMLPC